MESNLDKIALDLYDKIQTKFPEVEMGDEHGDVLSKKQDIPKARFFEFEYKENDKVLGTIAITLDADDGVVVQISREIVDSKHHGAYKFIRGFRRFAKDRLLNFDIKNIGKSNLDKRDYAFQSKAKEEPMNPIMENKMFGTSRMSYQDLGEARLIVKHSQAVNPDLPAGRTQHIEAIYIENANGERFRYPHKHLNGARALAEHIKAGGNPYDGIGKHITGLSEELAQLRKFKGYVGRNSNLAEAMGGITDIVFERIETIKKQVGMLQRPTYYTEFAESFEAYEDEIIPEEIVNDLVDRLTIRTFNEDLKSAFPYIFRLVDESSIPVKELDPEDLLNDAYNPNSVAAQHARDLKTHQRAELKKKAEAGDERAKAMLKHAEARDEAQRREFDARMERESYTPGRALDEDGNAPINGNAQCRICHTPYAKHFRFDPEGDVNGKITSTTIRGLCGRVPQDFPDLNTVSEAGGAQQAAIAIAKKKSGKYDKNGKKLHESPEEQFENFMDSIYNEGVHADDHVGIFSKDSDIRDQAIEDLNSLLASDKFKGGAAGNANIAMDLKNLVPNAIIGKLATLDPTLDVHSALQMALQDEAEYNSSLQDTLDQIDFTKGGEESSDQDVAAAGPAPDASATTAEQDPAMAQQAVATAPTAEVPPAAPVDPNAPPAPLAEDEEPPFDGPYTKARGDITDKSGAKHTGHSHAKHLAKQGLIKAIHAAKKAGADLDTELDFGHSKKTLHDTIKECGMTPQDFGFETKPHGIEEIMQSISGFWNRDAESQGLHEGNFTKGGTWVKSHVISNFKNGAYEHATPDDVRQVCKLIDQMDPPSSANHEQAHILKLAGVPHHAHEVSEDNPGMDSYDAPSDDSDDSENPASSADYRNGMDVASDNFDSLPTDNSQLDQHEKQEIRTATQQNAPVSQIAQMMKNAGIQMPRLPGLDGKEGEQLNFDDMGPQIQKWIQTMTASMPQGSNTSTSSGMIDGKPASFDDAMSKFKGMGGSMNPQDMMSKMGGSTSTMGSMPSLGSTPTISGQSMDFKPAGQADLLQVDNPEYVARRAAALQKPGAVVGHTTVSESPTVSFKNDDSLARIISLARGR